MLVVGVSQYRQGCVQILTPSPKELSVLSVSFLCLFGSHSHHSSTSLPFCPAYLSFTWFIVMPSIHSSKLPGAPASWCSTAWPSERKIFSIPHAVFSQDRVSADSSLVMWPIWICRTFREAHLGSSGRRPQGMRK